jgi:hypothetical protein
MYSLNCSYYEKEFTSIDELLDDVMYSGMDPNYEITHNGASTGETLADLILIAGGFVPVDLTASNVKIGDNISNRNMCFGTLIKITKKGNYVVRFDMDYADEKPSKFPPEVFERVFLVDKR